MAYRHGHVRGTKRESTPRVKTVERYRLLGARIMQRLDGKTTAELLNWKAK